MWAREPALEDLVLTGGYSSSAGGALYLYKGVVRARRCTFSHNRASDHGGVVATYKAYIIVEDSLFELNEAVEGSGGAMHVYSDSHATIHRTTFAKNKAGASGGGVSFAHNRPWKVDPSIVEDCLFDLNNASNTGGGMDVTTESTAVHASTTQFRHNFAGRSGGAVSASNDATLTVADSIMANNAASATGGSASATAAMLTFDNVNVTDSVAGRAGGAVAIAGDTSTGAFSGTNFGNCTASTLGGAIAASGNVPELTIEGGKFQQCRVEEQGGALHVDGTGVLRVANTSFEDSAVGYSTTPVCLTLTMVNTAGVGWQGAELFVFRKEDYHGEAVYGCPKTCDTGAEYSGSCDMIDYQYGTNPSTCDDSSDALTTEYQCDCSGCVCSGFAPPSHTYLHRFTLTDGFSAAEQVCFERGHGQGEYVILVTDDKWYSVIQWTLEGYVVDGGAHDLRHLDFTTLESKDGCEAPGEPQSVASFEIVRTKQKHKKKRKEIKTFLCSNPLPLIPNSQAAARLTSRAGSTPTFTTPHSSAPPWPTATAGRWLSHPTSL